MHVLSKHFKLADPSNRTSTTGGYWYDDLKQAYGWPSYQTLTYPYGKSTLARLDGTGATIATLISSDVLDSDSDLIFNHENFSKTAGVPDPVLYARRTVLGGNAFSATSDDSFEASLDVQELLTGAPGAHVVLYNIPDLSDESVLAGYTAIDEDNAVDAVSSSFGECELVYTAAYNNGVDQTSILKAYSELFKQGNSQGITFMASSGDEAGLEVGIDGQVGDLDQKREMRQHLVDRHVPIVLAERPGGTRTGRGERLETELRQAPRAAAVPRIGNRETA